MADKWGNRYEGRWTVWAGVVPVLRDEFAAIRVEPPDADGEGVEFRLYGRQPDGPDEAHQCKRYRDTSWTVHALDVEKVLAPLGRHLGDGVNCVFVSGTPSILRAMAVKAALPVEEWSTSLSGKEADAKDELITVWGVAEEEVHRRLGCLTVRTVDDVTLRVVVIEAIAGLVEGDPEEALLWLGDYLLDHLMVPLTAHRLWNFLRSKGFPPRSGRDPALSERVRGLTDRYIIGVERTRPTNLPVVVRAEVDAVVRALTGSDAPRVVAVTGKPGSGKSTLVAAVCARLTELGVVVGPLRLDMADDAWTAAGLGTQADIGFGGPPARILARAAGGEQAVLVVDQLDALSALSGRGETVVDGVREMLNQARATESLRVLVACRSHDLKHDRQLRQLLRREGTSDSGDPQTDELVEVPVGDLDVAQVQAALQQLGFAAGAAPVKLVSLLSNTFNLSLLASIVQDAQVRDERPAVDLTTVHAQHDLLAEYHRGRSRRLRRALGSDSYAVAVFRVARVLSDSGHLSVARTAVADMPDTVDALVHEGVLAADGGRLRFFHEAYFDYVFALQHVQAGRTAADLVRGDPQDLLRRGQVRALLTLERQQGESSPPYLTDLEAVLDRQLVRSHLRAAVLTWLKDQTTAHKDELRIVLEIAANDQDPMRWQAVRALSSQPFASELGEQGLLTAAADVLGNRPARYADGLTDLLRRFDEQSCAYLLFEGARQLPEDAAAASIPLARDPHTATRLVRALLRTVFLAGPTAGPATAKLFCTVVETLTNHALNSWAGQADENPASATMADGGDAAVNIAIHVLFEVDGTHALSTLAQRAPAHAANAIRVWLAAAERIADAGEVRSPVDDLLDRPATGLKIFETCAANAPVEFVQAILPFMLTKYDLAAMRRQVWRPARTSESAVSGLCYDTIRGFGSSYRSLGGEIDDALGTAVRLSAAQHPQVATPFITQLTTTDLMAGHQLAATAFGACAPTLLDDALAWAADPRVRGLPSGFTVGWAWGEVLAHVAATGTDEQRRKATGLAMDGYEDLDPDLLDTAGHGVPSMQPADEASHEARAAAEEQLVVLTVISRRLGNLTPPDLRDRQVRLEQKLGAVPDRPIVDLADLGTRSPVSSRVAEGFSDEEWLDTIHAYSGDSADRPGESFADVAADIAMQLETATKTHPRRFARLVDQIGPDANAAYVTAILRGLTSIAQALSDDDVRAAVDAVETVFSWPQPTFRSSMCALIAALTDRDLPETVMAMVGTIATTTEQPAGGADEGDTRLMTAGLNSGQGQAVHTLANLLAPAAARADRVRILLPVIQALLDDPHERTRVLLPPAIVRTYLVDQDAGVDLAELWLQRASDAGLGAPELDRLAWQLFLHRPQAGTRLVNRMIRSRVAEARTRGGALAALASLRRGVVPGEEAATDSLLHDALQDNAARRGVATLLAQLVDELPDSADVGNDNAAVQADRRLLIQLLDDDDRAVRDAAGAFALSLAHPLSRHATLLAATAPSRAFAERPGPMLHTLARATEHPPTATLDLCEVWLNRNVASAGDIQTTAAGDAYYMIEIVLATHAHAAVGSLDRQRCLMLLDRLVEAGAADADNKADDMNDF